MATKTLSENINQAISDFNGIKQAIIDKGVSVPSGTPTSEYSTKIGEIQSGGRDEEFIKMVEGEATEITLPIVPTRIGPYAFYKYSTLNYIEIPDGITIISNYAFYGCTNLALTSLPDSLTSIGTYAFQGCTNLALTSLPDGINRIVDRVFANCTNLALTSLPAGVTNISGYAFQNCTGLTELTFTNKSNPTIAPTAFNGCTNLTTIRVPWPKGAVSRAPWGATNANIVYGYTETA